jgi:hypothetical protein
MLPCMTREQAKIAFLAGLSPSFERPPSTTGWDDWIGDELSFMRTEAQIESEMAYDHWCRHPGADGYAVYRAAQDRADAAQDLLAEWMTAAVRR